MLKSRMKYIRTRRGKRWNIGHIFSRFKEVFDLAKNRPIGTKNVMVHFYS